MSSPEPSTGDRTAALADRGRLSSRATSALDLQERERVRIGFDLHDGPAQSMSAALLQVKMLQESDGDELHRGLDELRSTLTIALGEIYGIIETLGGRGSTDDDLVSRICACVDGVRERTGIDAHLSIEGDAGALSPSLRIATYRIVQEALSNVARHAEASRVDVDVSLLPTEVYFVVSDDGKGFSPQEAQCRTGRREPFGLRSMTERTRLLDGECSIESSPGLGTRVRVWIPVWRA